ncbi:uncharacterized protein LOC130727982 isoform X2 [Lotus japonicus]|uniref:uncharacterized protein LOC130727982 isoform X2 n=1 Tax=Lotus japonicus TaxID=34305 RepID=UPI002585B2E9|nr:uncharacterized protein LOC130727982 isoform X2 [Lotus japonicus]
MLLCYGAHLLSIFASPYLQTMGQKIEASARKAMISKFRLELCEGKVYKIALILIFVQGATCEWETVRDTRSFLREIKGSIKRIIGGRDHGYSAKK